MSERGWIEGTVGAEGPVRHQPVAVLPPSEPAPGSAPLAVAVVALLALIAGVAALQLANFVAAQFAQAPWLGWLTLGLLLPAVGVLGWSLLREVRGFTALQQVDGLRRDLASDDPAIARAAAGRWLAAIGAEAGVVQAAPDAATVRALLRAGPLAQLDAATAEAGRAAAFEVLAVVAVSPWPGLDGVMVVWRGLRLVRRVAELHGLRPGTLGTLRLFRRVALDAGSVMAADVAVSALAEAVFASPLGALAGQAAGAGLSARRMLRLAFAVAQSCRPL